MKPPRFTYHDPTTLAAALSLLADYGTEARLLAGGQSLMPLLNFRLARPAHLVDLNRIPDLDTIEQADGTLRLGCMVRQRTLERSAEVARACPLLGQALPRVGHPQIRNRGTLGGSLAHADPAAELPAVMLAADASFTVHSAHGQRRVAAEDFFLGQLTTALEPDEMLVHVELPCSAEQTGSSLEEVAIRPGDFALGGVATTLTLGTSGRIASARIVCFGIEDRPRRQQPAEQALVDQPATEASFAAAGALVADSVDTFDDIHASAAYRRRLVGLLVRRGLAASLNRIHQAVA